MQDIWNNGINEKKEKKNNDHSRSDRTDSSQYDISDDHIDNLFKMTEEIDNDDDNNKDYLNWDYKDIVSWIINIDNGRYLRYKDNLLKYMKEEEIDGSCLIDLDDDDLFRFGVKPFKDKINLLKCIKELVGK